MFWKAPSMPIESWNEIRETRITGKKLFAGAEGFRP